MALTSPSNNVWFLAWHRKPQARVRLFCFPYAGGGASLFRSWPELVPPELEICPVQLPGRENRLGDPPFSHLPALTEALAAALSPYLEMPYALFGHSMGALISFELARYLRRTGQHSGPLALFVSGHRAPHLPPLTPPIYHLPDDEFLAKLRHLQGTPEAVLQNEELLHVLMPLLRADFTLCETYTYHEERALHCPLYAFGGLQDADTPAETITAWRKQTDVRFQQRFFSGGHFFLHKERDALLRVLAQELPV